MLRGAMPGLIRCESFWSGQNQIGFSVHTKYSLLWSRRKSVLFGRLLGFFAREFLRDAVPGGQIHREWMIDRDTHLVLPIFEDVEEATGSITAQG